MRPLSAAVKDVRPCSQVVLCNSQAASSQFGTLIDYPHRAAFYICISVRYLPDQIRISVVFPHPGGEIISVGILPVLSNIRKKCVGAPDDFVGHPDINDDMY